MQACSDMTQKQMVYVHFKNKTDEQLIRTFLKSGDLTQSFYGTERELLARGYSPARIMKRYEKFIRRQVKCQES